jgi:hypothetical protein
MTREPDPANGRRVIFVKCRIEGESSIIMGIYDRSLFQNIFPKKWLKKYLEGI